MCYESWWEGGGGLLHVSADSCCVLGAAGESSLCVDESVTPGGSSGAVPSWYDDEAVTIALAGVVGAGKCEQRDVGCGRGLALGYSGGGWTHIHN